MKEPVLSRRKKPTAVAVARNGPSRKIKLVCSFNGAFQQRPPSGKLRYIGGETRIVSVDRTIGYAKLRSKISELCPTARSFSIKYLLPEAGNTRDDGGDAPLVLIASDDDVRCMIEEYDKLECYGKHARLWLYVCSGDCVSVKGNRELFVNFVDTDHLGWETNGVRERNVSGDHQVEAKTGWNSGNEVLCGDDSLRKVVLKQQILAKQSAKSVHCVSNVDGNETEMESACYVENQKYDHPLIDLSPQSHVQITLKPNLEKLYGLHMLDCQMINTHVPGSDHFGNLVTVSQPHPLNPRDGNIRVEANSSSQCLSGQSGQMFCNGDGISTGCSGPSVGIVQTLKQSCNRSMSPEFHNSNGKHNLGNSEQGAISIMNRENMPWAANCVSVKNDSVPLSCVCPLAGSCYSLIPKTSDRQWGVSQSGIRNHQFGVTDTRNQRVHLFHLRSHRNNVTEVNNHRTVRLDGRPLVGKCYPGFRPNSSISMQGQSVRPHHPLKLWTDFHDLTFEGKTSVVKSSNEESREQGDLAVLQHGKPCSKECHLSYDTCAVLPEKSLLSHDSVETASPCMETMDAQADHLMGLNNVKSEVPYKTVHESFRGVQMNCKTTHNDLEKEHILMDPLKVSNFSFSNNQLHGSTTELGCDINALDAEASSTLNGKFESSVDLPLHNLSLLSSEKVEPPVVSSLAGCDVSEALLKFQSKPSDLMVEVQLSRGPVIDESNGAAYPSPHVADKLENVYLHEKEIQEDPSSVLSLDEKADTKENRNCLKETGGSGISRDLSAFYTRLVTRELQTIKNSDLEHVKELGSGTYGTVFHGKWRGSDVAIKRIKPSCFTEGGVEEDRLVADFWREAHILAQLHHPNIVAFYGVVTDGPVTNLATVTEYMVNGSLKQVLRRRDRTIDRRKRLIIAMDAAFGMEYLHEKNIVHFDLKSHNFLVNMRDPQRPVCKIGDMGLSKIKQKTLISGGVRGTIPWMAPELLNSENNLVTEKVDVYSFGIVMWELLTGEEPYRNMRSEEIIAGIIKGNLRPEVPTWCEPAWRSLMKRCWSSDPDSRPSFSEVAKELRAMSATMNIN